MKPTLAIFTALLLATLASLHAVAHQGAEATSPCEAAFGFESFRLGGVFGRHVEIMMKGNLLRLDMEKDFLGPFRKRITPNPVYIGLGKTLDAGVHFAALTGDPEITAWKDKWIAETIGTMDPDGYLGISPRGAAYQWSKFGFHERGPIILALANDYRFFGHRESLEAARRIADAMLAEWPDDMHSPHKLLLWTVEYPLIRLSEISGDSKYTDFVRARFFPGDKLDKQWSWVTRPMMGHVYDWCDATISMLDLNRHHPHPTLTSAWPHMIEWLKDGGSVPTGEYCETERWTRGQPTRNKSAESETSEPQLPTKCGESCAKFYVVQLLDRLNRSNPDVFNSDVIERTFYNGLFAAMSPDGRRLCYSLSVEGTRSYWPSDTYCCPGNLRRAFAYLPHYFYALGDGRITVNLYGESEARLKLKNSATITLVQETDYPATGKIRFRVEPSSPVKQSISFRIPAWCRSPAVFLNGERFAEEAMPGTFLTIEREWAAGDTVDLDFPMQWRWIAGIRTQQGKAALARGPVVYSLDPVASGIDYVDASKDVKFVEEDKAHQAAYEWLQRITLNPASVSTPKAGDSGLTAEVRGWLGRPGDAPERTFIFRTFDQHEGRKIYFGLSKPEAAAKDELFATALHEDTVHPSRWAKIRAAIDEAKLRDFSFAAFVDALKVAPMFGEHESETAEGEIAGHPAWMSAATPPETKRRMNFRVRDPRFTNGACSELSLTIVYLDLGETTLSVEYDATAPEPTGTKKTEGTTRKAGEIVLGNSGEIRSQTFNLKDARFAKGVKPNKADFSLVPAKPSDFVILGSYLRENP
jgi:uncharacterized protein